jgi:hypothetical protein
MNGGKGVDESVAERPRLFVTLTAPGFGSVHTITSKGSCLVRHQGQAPCEHGIARQCFARHQDGENCLGQALCAECFDYRRAILWNAASSRLWTSTVQQARRNLAIHASIRREDLYQVAQMHYFKVAEMQRRGLIHFHVLVRLDEADSRHQLDADAVTTAWSAAIRKVSIQNEHGSFRWGRIVDIQQIGRSQNDARMVATYLAKYVTKTAGDALELARVFDSRRDIDLRVTNSHLKKMALGAWDMGGDSELVQLKLREHANTLGFSGHFITKSRDFSTTFGALRQARVDFNAPLRSGDPVRGTFTFEGRGYDDPKASQLAEVLSELGTEIRRSRAVRAAGDVSSLERANDREE